MCCTPIVTTCETVNHQFQTGQQKQSKVADLFAVATLEIGSRCCLDSGKKLSSHCKKGGYLGFLVLSVHLGASSGSASFLSLTRGAAGLALGGRALGGRPADRPVMGRLVQGNILYDKYRNRELTAISSTEIDFKLYTISHKSSLLIPLP